MVKSLLQKPNRRIFVLTIRKDIRLNHKADNHILHEFWRYSYGCAVPSTCKDYREENHGWSYLCKPYGCNTPAAAFIPTLALELGVHCLNVISIVLRVAIRKRGVAAEEVDAAKSCLEVVQSGSPAEIERGGNIVTDLLRELAALPTGSHAQGGEQVLQLKSVRMEDNREISPRLQIF
ncbi:hypothetical protein F2Q68_00002493 [Brassica cretica]|uniref:Uncharacterized protein n=1 Tax=Brassica cretica TaxID=69181 RepID=A0A8S9J666_BRACR|nr:hypothetical protein F2Q68_00002493 [Brassica cretica]